MRRLLMIRFVSAMMLALASPGFGQITGLSLTKTDTPDPVIAGNLLTYTLTATNNLQIAAANLTISDPLPATTVFISAVASPGATLTTPAVGSNGTVTAVWDAAGGTPAGLTAPGVMRTLTIVVRVCPEAGCGSVTNTATVSADDISGGIIVGGAEGISVGVEQSTTLESQGDLSIQLAGPQEALRGSSVTYILTVQNAGPSVLTNVQVNNVLPPGVRPTAVETTFTDALCQLRVDNGSVNCVFAIGAANQCSTTFPTSGTITIEALVLPTGLSGDNSATVTPIGECGSDPNLTNNAASLPLLVTGATAPALGNAALVALAVLLAGGGAARLRRRLR